MLDWPRSTRTLLRSDQLVQAMIAYLNQNYGQPITLKQLANALQHNTSYLCDLFSRRTGRTFHGCLDELRLARAKELLEDPQRSIRDVAQAVGYADPNYFRQAFKARTGLPPSEWRRRVLREIGTVNLGSSVTVTRPDRWGVRLSLR